MCRCYVVIWLWWCGILMQAAALVPQPAYGYHLWTSDRLVARDIYLKTRNNYNRKTFMPQP